MSLAAAVAVAGALGAIARFLVDAAVSRSTRGDFPWGTALVNILGSLLLGLLVGAGAARALPGELQIAVGGGFLGAFTTYSTWMVQCVELIERKANRTAIAYAVGSLFAGVVAAAVGLALGALLG
jgi:fluoride exporter